MKNFQLTLIVAAIALFAACKKDNNNREYLLLKYQTITADADTTNIDITGSHPLIASNVNPVVATQESGTIIKVAGSVDGNIGKVKVVTPKGSKGIIYVKWLYPNGRVADVPFSKSSLLLNSSY